jgi:hypothetical protein
MFYDLRHTFASRLVMAGVDSQALSRADGASVRTFKEVRALVISRQVASREATYIFININGFSKLGR